MSDEDDNYAGKIETQAQYRDMDRVTGPGYIDIDWYIDTIAKRDKLFMSEIQKFVTSVYNLSKELIDEGLLSPDNLNIILENISNLNKPGYKNSTSYVIGYIVSNGGNEFNLNNLKENLKQNLRNQKINVG